VLFVGADEPRAVSHETAADQITLRDGSVVQGLVTATTTGRHASVEFLVRRALAEKTHKQHLREWDRSTASTTRLALAQRRRRSEAWRRERASSAGPDDRIVKWINQELARLAVPGEPEPSVLLSVHLPRSEVRGVLQRPAAAERLLRLAWLCDLPDPESMPLDELKGALEGRGYAVDAASKTPPVALDRLLPPTPEADSIWLARRAATELAVDTGLRFIRFQDTVLPEPAAGQPLGEMGLSTAVSELKRLLDPDPGQRVDPLAEKLKGVATRGRVGAVVTQLAFQPDFSGVTVESTLWVRGGEQWVPFGSRSATVRPDDLAQEAGKNIEADPQVKGVFRIPELLGLGAIPPEIKERSLRMGAATQKALEMARSAFNQDLDALALPVLEPVHDDPAPAVRKGDQRTPGK
jgi:hypothetical protein